MLSSRPSPARAGFTLIELLVVVVIIGILAAVAIPKFSATVAKADLANVRSDLHSLTLAQEGYYYEHSVYTPSLALLAFQTSQGVNVTVVEATANGWSATLASWSSRSISCRAHRTKSPPDSSVPACSAPASTRSRLWPSAQR